MLHKSKIETRKKGMHKFFLGSCSMFFFSAALITLSFFISAAENSTNEITNHKDSATTVANSTIDVTTMPVTSAKVPSAASVETATTLAPPPPAVDLAAAAAASSNSNRNKTSSNIGDFLLDNPHGASKPRSASSSRALMNKTVSADAAAASGSSTGGGSSGGPSLEKPSPPTSFASETFRSITDGSYSISELRRIALAQQAVLEKRADEPAKCPPGGTADGVWGVNNPHFNRLDWYREAGKLNNTFGRWIAGPREEVLQAVCREQDHEDCEWQKPHWSWAPFRGSPAFALNKSAAFYYRTHGRQALYTTDQMVDVQSPVFNYKTTPPKMRNTRARAPPQHESQLHFCYDFQNPVKCLRGKTVFFLGDSHMLNLAQMLCRMVLKHYPENERGQAQSICGPLDVRFTSPLNVVFLTEANITIALLRIRYNLEVQMKKRFDWHPLAPFLVETASFVLYNRAIWDLVYKDTDRKVVAAEMAQSLKYLAARFKHARIIVKMLQYDQQFMKGCSDPERMRQIRDANICATYLAMEDVAQLRRMRLRSAYRQLFPSAVPGDFVPSSGGDGDDGKEEKPLPFPPSGIFDPHWKFSILDAFGMTRELPYGHGDNGLEGATDRLGHHYEGAAMESMVQQMLSVMCPSQPQSYSLLFDKFKREIAQTSCQRILHNTSSLRKPRCACNTRFSWMATKESKEFCTSIAKMGNWVAFLVDG